MARKICTVAILAQGTLRAVVHAGLFYLATRENHFSASIILVSFEPTLRTNASHMTDGRDRPVLCLDTIRVRHRYQFGAYMVMVGCHCGIQLACIIHFRELPWYQCCTRVAIRECNRGTVLEVCVYHSGSSLVVSLTSFGNVHDIVHESFRHITGTS